MWCLWFPCSIPKPGFEPPNTELKSTSMVGKSVLVLGKQTPAALQAKVKQAMGMALGMANRLANKRKKHP